MIYLFFVFSNSEVGIATLVGLFMRQSHRNANCEFQTKVF